MVDQSKAVVPYLRKFDEDELGLLRTMLAQVAPKATGEEKAMFLYIAQKKGLDPFDKQIYLVGRWDSNSNSLKHSVQVSIDGLRLMAQRSGKYAGQIGPFWCGKDRVWHDVWVEDEAPVAAKIGVLRHDFKEPLYSVALFESYKQTKKDGSLNVFWQKYGSHMVAKCFSEDTEVLTDKGFQKFSEATGRVLQVVNGRLEPTEAKPFVQDYSGLMVTLNSDDLNFCVTPNHDMITNTGKIEAQHLYDDARSRARYWIPRCIPGNQVDYDVSDNLIILAAAYLADGWDYNTNQFQIKVSRPEKIETLLSLDEYDRMRVRECAGSVSQGIGRKVTTLSDQTEFTYHFDRVSWLCEHDKGIKQDVLLSLSQRQARLFVDSLIAFDGYAQKDTGVRRFYSSRVEHIQAFELACVLAGYAVSHRKKRISDISTKPNYIVTVSDRCSIPVSRWGREYKNLNTTSKGKRKHCGLEMTENTSGKVWCVTVPSGVIVVRRKGFSMLCGNCAEALAIRRAFPEETSGYYIPEEMGNPEITHIMEVEQDNDAPLAESELVDESTSANGAKGGTTTAQATNGVAKQPTNVTTGQNTPQPTKSANPSVKPPVVNPSNDTSTTRTPSPNETKANEDSKNSEGAFTQISQEPAFDVKKALDKLYTSAMQKGIITGLQEWQMLKCDAFGRMVSDQDIIDEAMYETVRMEVIRQGRAKKNVA